jgi:hypothetical protein
MGRILDVIKHYLGIALEWLPWVLLAYLLLQLLVAAYKVKLKRAEQGLKGFEMAAVYETCGLTIKMVISDLKTVFGGFKELFKNIKTDEVHRDGKKDELGLQHNLPDKEGHQ